MSPINCQVCRIIGPDRIIELDLLLSDPLRWPSTVWGIFPKPKGHLPASYRKYGAIEMGIAWCQANGYPQITKQMMRRHVQYDVPVTSVDPNELVERGLIEAASKEDMERWEQGVIDPLKYMQFYVRGIELGLQGLQLLAKHLAEAIESNSRIDPRLALEVAKLGARLAESQAAIVAAGRQFGPDQNEDDGFRVGAAGGENDLPSVNFGGVRVLTIDGERRPIKNRGRADRRRYNARAVQEAGPKLPA